MRNGIALCWTHRKRLQRLQAGVGTLQIAAPVREDLTPLENVIVAGNVLVEVSAEDDAAYERALRTFRNACRVWMASLGWTPPAHEAVPDTAQAGGTD